MTHRYRNPYKFWVKAKNLNVNDELKCTKLTKINGDACKEVEFDFTKIDWV